jgi:hypothetical protein
MPKPRPKTTKKKTSSRAKVAPKSTLQKSSLSPEYLDFHKKHPNAEMLVKVFLVLTILLAVLYYIKYGFALMP